MMSMVSTCYRYSTVHTMSYVHPCLGKKHISHLSNDEKNLCERLGYVTKTTQLAMEISASSSYPTRIQSVPCHDTIVGFDHCSFEGGNLPEVNTTAGIVGDVWVNRVPQNLSRCSVVFFENRWQCVIFFSHGKWKMAGYLKSIEK